MRWRDLEGIGPVRYDTELSGAANDFSIVRITSAAFATIAKHADCNDEVIGLLCGEASTDPAGTQHAVTVTAALPMESDKASATAVRAGAESWRKLWPTLPPKAHIIGWYHSHPGHGVFFSERDRKTQQHCFDQPWSVGVVYDPVLREAGAFVGSASIPAAIELVAENRDSISAP